MPPRWCARLAPAVAWCAVLACTSSGWAQSFRQGGEFQVNGFTTGVQSLPAIAVSPGGDFVLAWGDGSHDGSATGVFGQRFDSAGARQGVEFQVNTYTTNIQHRASVASETNGDFVVVWQSFRQDGGVPGGYGVFGQRFTSAGARLGAEFMVNVFTDNAQDYPRVASDADGDFIVAWHSLNQDSALGSGVFARRFDSSGAPIADEFMVNARTIDNQLHPAVASASNGDFVITWESNQQEAPGSSYGVFARRYSSTGVALAAEFQVNTYTVGPQGRPAVATRPNGDFVIAWNSLNQESPGSSVGHYGIFARRFTSAGVAQAVEFQVNVYTTGYQRYPSIAADDIGNFVVTWESKAQDGSYEGVFARRILGNSAFGPEFQANSYTLDGQDDPVIDFDSSGDFVIAWWTEEAQDSSSYGVFAQRFTLPPLAILDVDGNGILSPLTDGLLVLRRLFTFSGTTLTDGAVGTNCTRCDAAAIEPYIDGLELTLDIDGNGSKGALTDGLLVLRFLFGFTGTTLTGGATAMNCTRCDAAAILPYEQTLD